jgi:hypothetical protein
LRGELGVRLEADHDFITLDQFSCHGYASLWLSLRA